MNVKALCLGALCLKDGTGYDIKKLFKEAFSYFHSASYGSIYPALTQLEQEGLIAMRVEAGERHPDRKVYSVTAAGREAFVEELVATEPTERLRSEFLVLMFFAHLLPNARLAALLDQVESEYRLTREVLESIYDCPTHTAGVRFTIGMGIAAMRAQLDYIAAQRESLLAHHAEPPARMPGEEPC